MQILVIDILDDPHYSFPTVFDSFVKTHALTANYRYHHGFQELDYSQYLKTPPLGIIVSGSLQDAFDDTPWIHALLQFLKAAHNKEIPILGICFGHQILARALGGKVERLPNWEFGIHSVYTQKDHPLLKGFHSGSKTIQIHQDHVSQLPEGAEAIGFSDRSPYQIFALKKSFGVQFHPEYTLSMLQHISQNRLPKFLKQKTFHSPEHLKAVSSTWHSHQGAVILKNYLLSLENKS